MDSDDIKKIYSMRQIVERYGIRVNRVGMCCCPFHGERHPSMKIYTDSYYCFACQETGDVFTFIQKMDNCDFKTAFIELGGEYKKEHDFTETQRLEQAKKTADRRKAARDRQKNKRKEINEAIGFFRSEAEEAEPLSDKWCEAKNALAILIGYIDSDAHGGNEIETSGIIGRYRRIKQGRTAV